MITITLEEEHAEIAAAASVLSDIADWFGDGMAPEGLVARLRELTVVIESLAEIVETVGNRYAAVVAAAA